MSAVFENPNLFECLDREYNYARGTPRAELLAEELGRRTVAPRARLALKRDACRFYRFNPDAPGWQALIGLADPPPKNLELVSQLCQALAAHSHQPGLRALALTPVGAARAVEVMDSDRDWLLANAGAIFQADHRAGPALFRRTAGLGYGWDRRALLELPLEILRPQAAFMPQRSLGLEDLPTYWERDFEWLCQNFSQICRQASDFFFYSQEFFRASGWRPDSATLKVWRQQARTNQHCYNSIPPLVEFDRVWLVKHLVEVVKDSGVRGIWVIGLLHRVGADIQPLIAPVRVLDRYPDNWEENLSFWFGCPPNS